LGRPWWGIVGVQVPTPAFARQSAVSDQIKRDPRIDAQHRENRHCRVGWRDVFAAVEGRYRAGSLVGELVEVDRLLEAFEGGGPGGVEREWLAGAEFSDHVAYEDLSGLRAIGDSCCELHRGAE